MEYAYLDLKTKSHCVYWGEPWSYKEYEQLKKEEFKEDDYCKKL